MTRGYSGLQGVYKYRRSQGVTWGYKGLKGVTGCYKGLQEVTRGNRAFLRVKGDY